MFLLDSPAWTFQTTVEVGEVLGTEEGEEQGMILWVLPSTRQVLTVCVTVLPILGASI